MTEPFRPHLPSHAESILRCVVPRVVPIDAALSQHVSQGYWDWQAQFDRDPHASPLQHPDYVLAEWEGARVATPLKPVLLRAGTDSECAALGILIPKSIRSGQVGSIGPSWMLHGLRLAGGRFLSGHDSYETQSSLLAAATQHCRSVGAAFLLIEDLDERSPLSGAVQNEAAHGSRLFATHETQPRWHIQFPSSAEEYWKTFSSRSLSKFRRSLKKFGNVRLERVTSLEQIPDFLTAAHDISKESWQSRQFGLRIRNDEKELHEMSILAQHGLLRSYLWWIEGRPSAFAICNQHRGCFRYEEIAYRHEYAQFSPGRVMLQQIVEDLFAHDTPHTFDFGGGDAEYKRQFANVESRSGTVWLVPRTWRAGAALAYIQGGRKLRSTARAVVQKYGLATKARQWIRRGGVVATTPTQTQPETEDSSHAD